MTQNVYSNANHTQNSDNTRIPFNNRTPYTPATGDATARNPRRYRDQARRLVGTRTLDRNTWLAIRRSGIGSSDAAAALGLNPYKSQLELWMEKTGRLSANHEPGHDEKLTSPLHWGQVLESIVADHYAQHTGHRVQRVNAILQHVEHPWMMANLDREVVDNDKVQILECKTAGVHGARLWTQGVPEYVQLQVMHQLAVTGQQAADNAARIAAVLAYLETRTDPTAEHINRAAALVEYYLKTMIQRTQDAANSTTEHEARELADWIRENGGELHADSFNKLPAAYRKAQKARQLLALLVDYGHAFVSVTGPNNKPRAWKLREGPGHV